jgi:hypothetical protein
MHNQKLRCVQVCAAMRPGKNSGTVNFFSFFRFKMFKIKDHKMHTIGHRIIKSKAERFLSG